MNADIHTLTGAYAVDALPDDERRTFEEHLALCGACRQEIAEMQATAAHLAGASAEAPPSGLKSAVMAAIDTVRQEAPAVTPSPRVIAPRWYQRLLAPAAAALVIAVLGLTAVVANLNSRIDQLTATNTAVTQVMAASDAESHTLEGPEGSQATVVVSRSQGEAVLLASGMPAAPGEQVYALWVIDQAGAAPAGLFDVGAQGTTTLPFSGDLAGAQAIGVTIEPAGGSPQPTSDPVMLVELGSA